MAEKISTLGVLLAVAAAPFLVVWYAAEYRPAGCDDRTHVIDITGVARRGIWTTEPVHNLNYWWRGFEPATLHLTLGESVMLRLHSADVVHQFYVPALKIGPVDVEPGHVTEVAFQACQEGVFQYFCTSLCGDCHFYMTGWIVVTPEGNEPPALEPIICPLCLPEIPPAANDDLTVQGEYLYRRMACDACHGPEGRGGVANYNYLNGEIVDHVELASRLFLRSAEDAEALVDWLEEKHAGEEVKDPDIVGSGIVLARMTAAANLIREGKNAAKADLEGPEPPLQMPAWKHKLGDEEIETILAYLITLQPWDDEEE